MNFVTIMKNYDMEPNEYSAIAPSMTSAAIPRRIHSDTGIFESSAASPKYGRSIPASTENIPLVARITLPKTGCKKAKQQSRSTCELNHNNA